MEISKTSCQTYNYVIEFISWTVAPIIFAEAFMKAYIEPKIDFVRFTTDPIMTSGRNETAIIPIPRENSNAKAVRGDGSVDVF